MSSKAIPIIIAALAVLVLALCAVLVWPMLSRGDRGVGGAGIDSGARIEIEQLRQQIEALQGRLEAVEREVSSLPRGGQVAPRARLEEALPRTGPNTLIDDYAKVVLITNRTGRNKGLDVASPSFLEKFLGRPRDSLSDECQPISNPEFKRRIVLADVGPIRVRLQKPAVESLTRVFERVNAVDPDLYARINSSGSLCVRQIRGTQGRLSSHSFGLAVDLNIDGQLDNFTDGKTQMGLTILADFFIEEGWIWGAGFKREDSMHFEVSKQTLTKWRAEGKI